VVFLELKATVGYVAYRGIGGQTARQRVAEGMGMLREVGRAQGGGTGAGSEKWTNSECAKVRLGSEKSLYCFTDIW
jgi:hypothetical protein